MWLPLFNITLKLSVVILGSLTMVTPSREFSLCLSIHPQNGLLKWTSLDIRPFGDNS